MQAVKQTVILESFDHREALKMLILSDDKHYMADYNCSPSYLVESFQIESFFYIYVYIYIYIYNYIKLCVHGVKTLWHQRAGSNNRRSGRTKQRNICMHVCLQKNFKIYFYTQI